MGRHCFCPGCKTGYLSDMKERKRRGEKMLSLYRPPDDPTLFGMWQRAIPRADKLLKPTDYVCIKHFKKEDVSHYFEPIKLFDGTVYLGMRAFPKLRNGAVPSIFEGVPGHSTYVEKSKSSDKPKKISKRQRRCATTKQSKSKKAMSISLGTEIPETKKCIPSKEKENVLQTTLNLLPSVILNCLTSEPHTVLATLNKSTVKDNCSSEANSLQFDVTNNTLEENDVPSKQSKLNSHLQSNLPERVSSLSPKSNLTSNSEVIPHQLNLKNNISVLPQESPQSSKFTKDFSANSQEIVEPSDFQSNQAHSKVDHDQSSCQDDSTTEHCIILQPLSPQTILTTEPDIIQKASNNQSSSAVQSKPFPQPSYSSEATEVNQELPDTSFSEAEVSSFMDFEIGVDNLALSAAKKQCCFNFLKDNAHTIDKMNSWWTVNTFDDFIICARWNSDCLVERKIVIYEDLQIKVFLKERETTIGNDLKATSIETISHLIFRVERLKLCKNVMNREENCLGFLQANYLCKRRNCCLNCIDWEKERWEGQKHRLKKQFHIEVSQNQVSQNQVSDNQPENNQVELIRFYVNT